MEINFERYRHYDQDIENAILGVILMEKSAMAKTIGLIQPEYFYSDAGEFTYGVLVEMFNNTVPIDLLTVSDYFVNQKKKTHFANNEHVSYALCKMTNQVVSGAHLEYHCYILKQQWQRRCVLKAKYGALVEDGVNPLLDVENLNKQLQNILGGTVKRDWVPLDEAIFELVKHQQDMANGKANIVPTGIKALDKVNRGFSAGDMIIVAARPGVGKCLGEGTVVLMHNGELKKVDDIIVGDKLMGIDSKPRNVLSICEGYDKMYEVTQKRGVSFRVNSKHILSLKRGKTEYSKKHGMVWNVNVEDYFNKPKSTRERWKGYMSDCIHFDETEILIDPYFLGLWLGDGTSSGVGITSADKEVKKYINKYATDLELDVRTETKKGVNKASTYHICNSRRTIGSGKSNIIYHQSAFQERFRKNIKGVRMTFNGRKSIISILHKYNLLNNKHIPKNYIINTEMNRLSLLAGIIDSDGTVNKNGVIEICLKDEPLINQIKFLCNTLGFRTSVTKRISKIKSIGYSCVMHRLRISGDVKRIPLKIERKKSRLRDEYYDASMTKINIKEVGIGKYYGFEIDGDNLFLLEDCTVTHNSALMGRMALQMASEGKKVGIITLEMSNVQITARMAAIETNTDFSKVYWGMMEDMEQFRAFYDKISKQTVHLQIYLSEKAKVNITEIRAKAIKLKASYGCDVLFIDYLQLIEGQSSNRNTNREQEVSQMSRGIKVMAKELEIPVIALAQLNREVAKRSHAQRLPMLTDLRESGSIEQDADVVMFLHSDFHAGYEVNEQGQSTKEEADLIVRKWRNGSHPHIKLGFDPPKMKFYEKHTNERPAELPKNGTWRPVDYSSPKEIDDGDPF